MLPRVAVSGLFIGERSEPSGEVDGKLRIAAHAYVWYNICRCSQPQGARRILRTRLKKKNGRWKTKPGGH